MSKPRVYADPEKARRDKKIYDRMHRSGYTREFAMMSPDERRLLIVSLINEGKSDIEISAQTGYPENRVTRIRYDFFPKEKGELIRDPGETRMDTGAYMAEVKRKRIPGPPSFRFKPNPAKLQAVAMTSWCRSTAEMCAEGGEHV